MKKFAALSLIFILLLSTVSCGSDTTTPSDDKYAGITLDLEALAAEIASDPAGDSFADELVQLSPDVISASYGFKNADETVVWAGGGATAEEIIAVKASDKSAMRTELVSRIDSRKKDFASYNAAEVPKLDDALILTRGDYVFCVVASSIKNAESVINSYCENALKLMSTGT